MDEDLDLRITHMIERINESLKGHERTHRTLMTLCSFGLVTFISAPDINMLFNNGAQSNLPILNISLSFHSLAWVLPIFISLVYSYYIYRLGKTYHKYSTEGIKDNYNRTTSSIFDTLFQLLRKDDKRTYKDSLTLILITLYTLMMPPASLLIFHLICLKRHDNLLSAVQFTAFIIPLTYLAASSLMTYILYHVWPKKLIPWFIREFISTYRSKEGIVSKNPRKRLIRPVYIKRDHLYNLILLTVTSIAFVPSYLILKNLNNYLLLITNPSVPSINLGDSRFFPDTPNNTQSTWLADFGVNPFMDLRTKDVSKKPINWNGEALSESMQILNVEGANLLYCNLNGANLERVFLARANLRGANLQNCYLRAANLAYANLRCADLTGAYIRLVNFRNADLRQAIFDKIAVEDFQDPTYILGPDFQNARFDFCDLSCTPMHFPVNLIKMPVNEKHKPVNDINCRQSVANLEYYNKNLPLVFFGLSKESDVDEFKMSEVGKKLDALNFPFFLDHDIRNGILVNKTFSPNFSMEDAIMPGFDLSQSVFRNVNLKNASFKGATLNCTDFTGANLRNADFTDADLTCANFTDAILNGAIFKDCINIEDVQPDQVRELIKSRMKNDRK